MVVQEKRGGGGVERLEKEEGKAKSHKGFWWAQITFSDENNGCFDLFHGLRRGSSSLNSRAGNLLVESALEMEK